MLFYNIGNGWQYFLSDGLSSIVKIANIEGDITATFTYDPFGVILDQTGSFEQALLFTGEYQDMETGFIYLRARYYDPYTGRFITQDDFRGHLSDPKSLHRYVYVYNNPINFTDPSGYSPLDKIHVVLDIVGLFPVVGIPADLTNATIYLIRNDYTNAAISAAATVPFLGTTATVAKYGHKIASSSARNVSKGTGNKTPDVLYHYTNRKGMDGILTSGQLNPSLRAINPNDVRYGNGQYLSDIVPGTKSPSQLSREFINNPFQGNRYNHHVAIDVRGLNVQQGRNGVFVIPNNVPLDVRSRIVGYGPI